MRDVARKGGLVVALLVLPVVSAAQGLGSIAGVVRDASGAVLPGVTVEAASPALIEKVRTVVTDDTERYAVVSLPLGVYSVTYTLAGFNVIKREGIEVAANFTTTANADLAVGALSETVTAVANRRSLTCGGNLTRALTASTSRRSRAAGRGPTWRASFQR